MNKKEIQTVLNRIGSGWFVLRLANELGISTYNVNAGLTKASIATRESNYRRNFNSAKKMLEFVVSQKKISFNADPSVDVAKIARDTLYLINTKYKGVCNLKTKAARGMHKADVANNAIRNILSNFSVITEEDIYASEKFFDWKCPYTGRDLKDDILSGKPTVELDHIVGINRFECGINVVGNLIYSDKTANREKGKMSYIDYINSLPGLSPKEKKERIDKINKFQKHFKYNPDEIKIKLQPTLEKIYKEVEDNQDNYLKLCKSKI